MTLKQHQKAKAFPAIYTDDEADRAYQKNGRNSLSPRGDLANGR